MAPKKRCVAGLILFGALVSVSCFAQPVFFTVPTTPYDHQMHRVYPALTSADSNSHGPLSLEIVNEWMAALRAMPYRYSPYWQTPREIAWTQATDCKGKAVALYAQMRSQGATN